MTILFLAYILVKQSQQVIKSELTMVYQTDFGFTTWLAKEISSSLWLMKKISHSPG